MLSSGISPVTCERTCSWNRLNTSIATPGTPAERIFSVAASSPCVVMPAAYDACHGT